MKPYSIIDYIPYRTYAEKGSWLITVVNFVMCKKRKKDVLYRKCSNDHYENASVWNEIYIDPILRLLLLLHVWQAGKLAQCCSGTITNITFGIILHYSQLLLHPKIFQDAKTLWKHCAISESPGHFIVCMCQGHNSYLCPRCPTMLNWWYTKR